MTKSKTVSILLAVVIFLVGIGCGALIHQSIIFHRIMARPERPPLQMPGHPGKRMLNKFSKKLDLTAEQKKELARILEKHRQQMMEIREKTRLEFKELRLSLKNDIAEILNDQQKEKLKKMLKKRRRRGERPKPKKGLGGSIIQKMKPRDFTE